MTQNASGISFYFSVAGRTAEQLAQYSERFQSFFSFQSKSPRTAVCSQKQAAVDKFQDIICPFTSSWGQPGRLLALSGRRQELKQRKRFTFLAGLFFPALALGDFLVALGLATFAGEALAGLGAAGLAGEAALGAAFAGEAALGAAFAGDLK